MRSTAIKNTAAEMHADQQLSLFENHEPIPTQKNSRPPTVLDFIRDRFENGPDMTQEEYRQCVRLLVTSCFKRIG